MKPLSRIIGGVIVAAAMSASTYAAGILIDVGDGSLGDATAVEAAFGECTVTHVSPSRPVVVDAGVGMEADMITGWDKRFLTVDGCGGLHSELGDGADLTVVGGSDGIVIADDLPMATLTLLAGEVDSPSFAIINAHQNDILASEFEMTGLAKGLSGGLVTHVGRGRRATAIPLNEMPSVGALVDMPPFYCLACAGCFVVATRLLKWRYGHPLYR